MRYALVEVVNLHDESLVFEPIHRVVFGVDEEKFVNALAEKNTKSKKRTRAILKLCQTAQKPHML
ncbi:MAG: DUF1015 domain-containing protein [Clostridiales bacterium]|nr:MAG: DUF1015 domain-containing protein [Clostridiales bacterium]